MITLDGTVTDDGLPEPSALKASWTQVSGPSPVVFHDPEAAITTATLDRTGVYVLRLTGSDGELTNDDDAVITVVPAPLSRVRSTMQATNGEEWLLR